MNPLMPSDPEAARAELLSRALVRAAELLPHADREPQPGAPEPLAELPDPEAVRAELLSRALARAAELLPHADREPQPGAPEPLAELPDPEAVRAELLSRALARAAELLPHADREPQPGAPEPLAGPAQRRKPPRRDQNSSGFTTFARDPAQRGDLLRRIELGLPILIRALGLERDLPDPAPLLAHLGSRFPITVEQRFRDEFRGFVADYAAAHNLDWRTEAITTEVIAEMAEMAAVRTVLGLARVEAEKAGSFPWARHRIANLQQHAWRVEDVRQAATPLKVGSIERRFVERIMLDAEDARQQYSKDYDIVVIA